VLTVEDGAPASHARRGWESLTDAVVQSVARRPDPVVFMLWGAHAQTKSSLIESIAKGRHVLLQANHPSPLSARRPPVPFIGCGHFSRALGVVPGLQWHLGP
jgi:uracil-DNA glycosylase